jgi:AraC-like DNA-binding protein
MHDWHSLTPVYAPELSGANLMAQGEVFWIGDGRLCPQDRLPPHWHDTYEMGFIHTGTGVIVLGEEEYPYQPGQIYIVNDLEPHMGYTDAPCTELFVVHFHPALLDENWITQIRTEAHVPFMPNFSPSGPLIPLDDEVTVPVRNILEKIRQEAKHRDNAWEIVVGGLILQAIGNLARRLLNNTDFSLQDMKRRQALKQIRPILHMVEQRYAEPLSLDEIAQEAYISRSHCCALFQTALNTTPIAYRNSRRLTEARRLLQNTDLTVREIAYQVGFSSVQQFNRLFLRETNMSPTRFRQRLFKTD